MVARRDERITRIALGSANRGGRLKSGADAPQLVETIRVDAIDPDPNQPRRNFDAMKLKELADSLLTAGQIQPIVVAKSGDRFIIHVGERRWRASALAGLATIRALVRTTPLEVRDTIVAQVVENGQRADLTTTELVGAVRKLSELGMRNAEIARSLAKNPTRVSELQALAAAPAELVAIADEIGLGLSYQLLRQWRAHPEETREFVASVPVEHISRFTISTIGQPVPAEGARSVEAALAPPRAATAPSGSEGAGRKPVQARASGGRDGAGQGGDAPPGPDAPRPRSDRSVAGEAISAFPRSFVTGLTTGGMLVEHQEHGLGYLMFDRTVPADHLAIAFRDGSSVVAHKEDVRIVRTFASDDASR